MTGPYENLVLRHGRPEDSRLPKEMAVYDLLDSLGVSYDRVDHEPMSTMEDCRAIDQILDIEICKNLFLCNRQETQFYLLMMPGSKLFRTKVLSAALGSSRLSFAPPSRMEELLNLTPGSVSVLGLMNDTQGRVKFLMDVEAAKPDYIGCHPCMNTSSLKIATADLLEKILPAMHHDVTFVEL